MCWRVNDTIILKAFSKAVHQRQANFGYKLRYLNTKIVYLIQCNPYSSKDNHHTKLGSERSVVTRLGNKLPSEFSFNVRFCDLFKYLALLNHLYENGTCDRGTLRANWTNHCLIKGDLRANGKVTTFAQKNHFLS